MSSESPGGPETKLGSSGEPPSKSSESPGGPGATSEVRSNRDPAPAVPEPEAHTLPSSKNAVSSRAAAGPDFHWWILPCAGAVRRRARRGRSSEGRRG
eukprot:13354586-Alexandrium_andersonii.AAC.1